MNDYDAFVSEMGLTPEQMESARLAMPAPLDKDDDAPYCIAPSPIHGLGCFASRDVSGRIGTLRKGSQWTQAGRYINHSSEPNANVIRKNDHLVVFGSMKDGDEITLDYRNVVDAMKRIS